MSSPILVRFLFPRACNFLPHHYMHALPSNTIFVSEQDHETIVNTVSHPRIFMDIVEPLSTALSGSSSAFTTTWIDALRYIRVLFLWSTIPQHEHAYALFPAARYAVFFFIECRPRHATLALAYVLWHISDSCYYRFESNAILQATSYVVLSNGVYGFSLYDAGLQPVVQAYMQRASFPPGAPPTIPLATAFPPHSDLVRDIHEIQRCSLSAAFLHVSPNDM